MMTSGAMLSESGPAESAQSGTPVHGSASGDPWPLNKTPAAVLEVQHLQVSYRRGYQWHTALHDVNFAIAPGEMVALVGESGSGKTTTAHAIIGLLASNARRDNGAIIVNGQDISAWNDTRLDSLRGKRISLVPQDPGNSLDPLKTIGQQVSEILMLHTRLSKGQRQKQVVELLERVGITYPESRIHQYPHQLSGGMKQRVLIAIAVALKPELIIADEPTSALDVTVQKKIVEMIDSLRQEFGTAVLFVTHDLALAAEHAERIIVFKQGSIQEEGPTHELVTFPQHPYTQQLLRDAGPARFKPSAVEATSGVAPVILMKQINKTFQLDNHRTLPVLQHVGLSIQPGTTHALVGESGSGKTTLARILMGFEHADNGEILIDGQSSINVRGAALRRLRRKIQFVYQNPFASINPRQRLFDVIAEPLRNYEHPGRAELIRRVHEIAIRVALPLDILKRRTRELSGGQRQRVALARALILKPDILVLDEATSALDVTLQAQILALLHSFQEELGITYLFITHDLAIVRDIAHSVTVLKDGRVVDEGTVEEVFHTPSSSYTRELIDAIPVIPTGTSA